MKSILLFLLLAPLVCNSQDLKKWEVKRLNNFGIELQDYDFSNQNIKNDFMSILNYEKKKRRNKTWSIILTSLSIVKIGGGIITISANKDTKSSGFASAFGGGLIVLGVVEAGISIPFHIGIRKNKNRRDNILKSYQ